MGTVRKDYSASGDAWNYFPHEQARSRAYHWGEDGIGGIGDDKQHLCLPFAFWNVEQVALRRFFTDLWVLLDCGPLDCSIPLGV
ncbi:hypothetical protein BH20VER3_BH20VER3_15480 [soil metagenome]